ncbi:sensor histidine kinase [Schaedlerella sp.]|uniref:cache domain-containing sensor histidine kinase n=1 Tax=Schaedlerella sp. TaxID=2676057 RepID=UPI003744D46B
MRRTYFFTNWNMKRKILAVFLPLLMLSTLLILVSSISLIIRNGKAEALNNAKDKLSLVTGQTDQILSNITYNIKAFSTSSALQDAIRAEYPDNNYGNYMFSSTMHNAVHNIMEIQSLISSGYIHTRDGRVFDIKTDEIRTPDAEMDARYREIAAEKGRILLEYPADKSGAAALTVSKSLIDIRSGSCLGILTFDIKESLFYDSYHSVSDEENECFLLIDSAGTIISSENRDELQTTASPEILGLLEGMGKPEQKTQYKSGGKIPQETTAEHMLLLSSETENGDYLVVYMMRYYRIYKEALNLALFLLIIGILVLAAGVLLSSRLAQSIVGPVIRLADYADEAGKGNFDLPVPVHSGDEIGFLAERFGVMNHNIKELTTRIYNEQTQKKEYELKMLQAQINPHFLYNCLDNISSLITDQKNETATAMVSHLGRYYRAILSKGRNIITIREELELIRAYLEIQLIRIPDLFTYEITVDEDILDFKILKMILQPIVENSVIHGFAGFKNSGRIKIEGTLENQTVCILISDNGKGIPEGSRSSIFAPAPTAIPKHFGLKNIQERIRLKHGEKYGISIKSEQGQGTQIEVRFPKTL